MGVDAFIYVTHGPDGIPEEELAAANAYLLARLGTPVWDPDRKSLLERWPHMEPPRVAINAGNHRIYRPGYERGPWPMIYAEIMAMRGAFPDRPVHYGSDHDDYDHLAPVASNEYLADIWAHWQSPAWDDYRKRRAAEIG